MALRCSAVVLLVNKRWTDFLPCACFELLELLPLCNRRAVPQRKRYKCLAIPLASTVSWQVWLFVVTWLLNQYFDSQSESGLSTSEPGLQSRGWPLKEVFMHTTRQGDQHDMPRSIVQVDGACLWSGDQGGKGGNGLQKETIVVAIAQAIDDGQSVPSMLRDAESQRNDGIERPVKRETILARLSLAKVKHCPSDDRRMQHSGTPNRAVMVNPDPSGHKYAPMQLPRNPGHSMQSLTVGLRKGSRKIIKQTNSIGWTMKRGKWRDRQQMVGNGFLSGDCS